MPLYDAACETCGVNEVVAVPSEIVDGRVRCGVCKRMVPQKFSDRYGQYVRVDAGGETIQDAKRVREGTADFNLGLYGTDTVVGERKLPNGGTKPKLAYRPRTHAELGNNRGVREEAKRQGLTPVESAGRYRTVGQ
ncbi:MAG: hypothetical protein ACREML_00185 [Vulcanimicrobiaceae bacterium]